MAALSGLNGSAVIYDGSAGTAAIVGIGEWSIDIGHNVVETTGFGQTWKKFITGLREYSGSFSGFQDTSSTNATLRNALLGGSAVGFRFYDSATTYWDAGTILFTGGGHMTSIDGKAEQSWDFQGSDALTYV